MKIGQLIDILKQYDPEMEIFIWPGGPEYELEIIYPENIKVEKVSRWKETELYVLSKNKQDYIYATRRRRIDWDEDFDALTI